MVACLTREGLATAIVIPITVVSLLSQFDVAASTRAALGFVITNITGGVGASVAFGLLQVRPSLIFLFSWYCWPAWYLAVVLPCMRLPLNFTRVP